MVNHFISYRLIVNRMNEIELNSQNPFFSLNILNEFAHDFFDIPSYIDIAFKNMLERLEKKGYLDNTLLLIFSDHGSRLSSYSLTLAGQLERKLPFLSLRLPKKLWKTNYHLNAANNKEKLIGAYDIYQTLRHFLHLNYNYTKELNNQQFSINDKNTRFLRGISLFEKIDVNRSCADALIPAKFCLCNDEPIISESEFESFTNLNIIAVKNFILTHVNNLTTNFRDKCSLYTFEKLEYIKRISTSILNNNYQFYVILEPGYSWFEITFEIGLSDRINIINKPIRLSSYRNQSYCIDDIILKNYCYCKN